jgi:hypothetical protein
MLRTHDGELGRAYRRAWDALVNEFGPPAPRSLIRLEMGRVAVLWLAVEDATHALAKAQRSRDAGRGRRPGSRELERLNRRLGLADGSYSQALDKLRALIAGHRPPGDPLTTLLGNPR